MLYFRQILTEPPGGFSQWGVGTVDFGKNISSVVELFISGRIFRFSTSISSGTDIEVDDFYPKENQEFQVFQQWCPK